MALHPDSPYSPVPDAAPTTQAPNDYIRAEATPQDMGGQIGQATQQLGQTGVKLGADALDLATQQQGMINQSLATNAETDYQTKLSAITDKYKTLQGLDAVSAHDQTIADITALRQQTMASIPTAGAQRAFNMLAVRHEGYAISDVGSYWSQQIKAGAVASSQAMATNAVSQAGTSAVAQDDDRFNYHLQTALFGLNDMMKQQGYGSAMTIDPKTGVASFDTSTAQGQAAQQVYTEQHDKLVGQAWKNRIQTLADDPTSGSVTTALQVFNANKDKIPPVAQMELSSYLTPKMRAVSANNAAGAAIAGADAGYVASIGTPSGSVRDAIRGQEGPGTSIQGAVAGLMPATFAQYAKPGESFSNPADRAAVNTRVLDDLTQKAGGDPARIAVGYFSGPGNIAPPSSPTPWISDKADANGKQTSSYVSDVLGRMGRGSYQVASTGSDIPPPPVGGALVPPPPQTKADYYRAHEADIVQAAQQAAMVAHPDDPMAAELAANRAQQQVSAVIRQQEVAYKADSDTVYQAANGDLAKGTAPLTVDQLRATNPQVAQAWDRLQAQQPQVAHEVATRLLTENARTNGGKDAVELGAGYQSVFNRIHAPLNDPNRITSPDQIVGMVGQPGGITQMGWTKAQAEISSKGTPEGAREAEYRQTLFANARQQLVAPDTYGQKDPKGEEQYQKFMTHYYNAADALKAKGMTLEQIYDPDSKDYVGKLIQTFKRSPAQYQADLIAANPSDQPQAAPAAPRSILGNWLNPEPKIDTSTPEGVRAAYRAGKMSREDALKALTVPSAAAVPAAAPSGSPPPAQVQR